MTTYKANYEDFSLTTEHATSSYGVPVMIVSGKAYGRCDVIPSLFGDEQASERARREKDAMVKHLDACKRKLSNYQSSDPWPLDDVADSIADAERDIAMLNKFIGQA